MIVKIQLPMSSTEYEPQALVYDKDKKMIFCTLPISKDLVNRMDGRLKGYFHAILKNGELTIGDGAPEQEW